MSDAHGHDDHAHGHDDAGHAHAHAPLEEDTLESPWYLPFIGLMLLALGAGAVVFLTQPASNVRGFGIAVTDGGAAIAPAAAPAR